MHIKVTKLKVTFLLSLKTQVFGQEPTIVGKEVPADQGLLNTTALTIIASFIAVQNHISLNLRPPLP